MKKRIALIIAVVLGFSQISKAQTDCQGSLTVNVGSIPDKISIFHSGFYFAFPEEQNNIVWEVTNSLGEVIVLDTIVGDQHFTFNHNLATSDTIHIKSLLTNLSANIACLFEGNLYWKETKYTTFSIWNWAFVNSPVGSNVLDIENINGFMANIYPNPTNDIVNIILEKGSLKKIELYSLTGTLLFKKELKSEKYALDLSDYNSGIYYLKVINQDDNLVYTRILKI